MANLDSIFKSRDITLPTKVRLVKAMVFPVIYVGMELLYCMVALFSGFTGICILFSIVVATIYVLTNSVGRFPFLHTICSMYYL